MAMVDTVYWLPIGGPAVPADWLGPKVDGHLAPLVYSSREPSELSQWLCHDDSTINSVVVIIIIIINLMYTPRVLFLCLFLQIGCFILSLYILGRQVSPLAKKVSNLLSYHMHQRSHYSV